MPPRTLATSLSWSACCKPAAKEGGWRSARGPETTLGRSPSAGLTIPSQNVSRRHAEIVWSSGEPRIRDLGSSNGTLVNGLKVDQTGHALRELSAMDAALVAMLAERGIARRRTAVGRDVVCRNGDPTVITVNCNPGNAKGELVGYLCFILPEEKDFSTYYKITCHSQ